METNFDFEDLRQRMEDDKRRVGNAAAKAGFLLKGAWGGAPRELMLDYWDRQYREGVVLDSSYWDSQEEGQPNPILRML